MALVRFYFGVDPQTIEDFAILWGQLEYALEFEGKLSRIKRG